jgi:hypothetical protein
VKNHVQKILRKLNVANRAQAVGKALEARLIRRSPPPPHRSDRTVGAFAAGRQRRPSDEVCGDSTRFAVLTTTGRRPE